MILSLLISFLFSLPQDTIPYKPKPDFEMVFYYEMKSHNATGSTDTPANYRFREVYLGKGSRNPSAYLTADLKVKKLSADEARYRIVDNAGRPVTSQKLRPGNTIHLALGFISDMKSGDAPNGYKIIFTSKQKVDISQIEIRVLEDGAFIVNGEYHLFLPHGF